jgi:adenosylcobinamide amidohydrolase
MRITLAAGSLAVEFAGERRTLSSAVLGGGMGTARTWLNVTVPAGYARTDPADDLAERACRLLLPTPVVGMLTAVPVAQYQHVVHRDAQAIATVGARHALAAAGTRPRALQGTGTINLLVIVDAPLDDAALAGAAQTAVEAKAQALAAAGVAATNAAGFATGTATDCFCVAALPGGGVPFAGPATGVGSDVAHAVFAAVSAGVAADRRPAVGNAAEGSM